MGVHNPDRTNNVHKDMEDTFMKISRSAQSSLDKPNSMYGKTRLQRFVDTRS